VSSASVRFDFSTLPFAFSIFLCSLLFPTFSPKLFHSYFFSVASPLCPLCFSFVFGSSSSFYSQRTRVFLVSQRASQWRGMSAAIRSLLDLETAPLSLPTSPSFIITEQQLLQTVKCVSMETAPLLVLLVWSLNFPQFYNQTPDKIVIGSLNFGAFSGLVLGFGLCQLNH